MPSSNPLPPKENAIFRKILKCYEMKQYKNGLKLAKQILTNQKYSEHGETLSMKGLILNCLGRKDEAYDHVRKGLRNDLKSHVCWHVYGLLQRSDKKYDEAIKCYRNALKWEKDNIQILRDLSLLQIQMGDLEGYKETRHQLFKLRPSQHASWIGFAMSYHLLNEHDIACSILETFRASLSVDNYDYKHSEFLLYQNQVIQESGNLMKAYKHLQEYESQILDKSVLKETMGELCLKMERFDEAVPLFMDLMQRNPDNSKYFHQYLEAKQIRDPQEILKFYDILSDEFPRSLCVRRLPLEVAQGNDFKRLMHEYLTRHLRKGVPPLFVNVRSLYKDPAKVSIITDLMLDYVDNLSSLGCFIKEDAKSDDYEREPASALLWSYYYLAQHYDYLCNTEKALTYVNLAISHTPTLIELFVCKGKIFKHAGDSDEGYKWLDEAQSLDTADRYINSKCAKYMLRANKVKEAEEMCAKFTREGVSVMESLNEMQCMWFQMECALSYQRTEKWGEALKKCHEIDRHFAEIIEDQFDFHTYCMRKLTLRSYVDLLRLENVLQEHPFYFKAAKCAIEVYIKLFDEPLTLDSATEDNDIENLSPAELKKLRNKQRKAKKKAEIENAQAVQALMKKEQYNKARQQNQDGDPEAPILDELIPEKLEHPDDPLGKAIDFLKPLQNLAQKNIETHLLTFEIYYRKSKLLIMLKALKRAYAIDSNNATLHECIIRYKNLLASKLKEEEVNEHVCNVIKREKELPINGKSCLELNEAFIASNQASPDQLISAAKMSYIENTSTQKDFGMKLLMSTLNHEALTLNNALKIKKLFENVLQNCEKEYQEFIEICHKRFQYAMAFKPVVAEDNSNDSEIN